MQCEAYESVLVNREYKLFRCPETRGLAQYTVEVQSVAHRLTLRPVLCEGHAEQGRLGNGDEMDDPM